MNVLTVVTVDSFFPNGFHTREGRAIRGIFEENYYSCLNQC